MVVPFIVYDLLIHNYSCQTQCMGDSKFHIPGQHRLISAMTKEHTMRVEDSI